MGSIPDQIVSKIVEAQSLAIRMADFERARALEMAALELSTRLLEGGPGRAGYALNISLARFLSLSQEDSLSGGEQEGYGQAAGIIEGLVDDYGLFAEMPQSYFERHPAWKNLSESEYPRAVPAPIGEIVVLPTEEAAGSADASSAESTPLEAQLRDAEAELLLWATGGRSSNNLQLTMEAESESRGETLVRIAQQDAAELEFAIRRVEALRLLLQAQPNS